MKAAWEERLKDATFAADPRARMRFFYERHPTYDTALNLYPVFRVDTAPAGLRPHHPHGHRSRPPDQTATGALMPGWCS